ncbi:hypothetical protein HY992_03860 [Candidatus Micrarchaeota archaeon]|nr:hypothetical protein [Candidatus Micrarchaeota archaeon]
MRFECVLVLFACVLLFGCFGDSVPKQKYDELEGTYAQLVGDYNGMRTRLTNLTEERNKLYLLSENLSIVCQEAEDSIQTYVDTNKRASVKIKRAGKMLEAHEFILGKAFVENPELQDVADAGGMVSAFNDVELNAKWQAFVSCGACTDKEAKKKDFQLALLKKAREELANALVEIKIE